jgi:hypothetical protein
MSSIATRLPLLNLACVLLQLQLLLLLVSSSSGVYGQLLSAQFSQCLGSAAQAPADQKLNFDRVYAQLDTGRGSDGSDQDNTNHQAVLRLVALGETGTESQGFSNETNYLGEQYFINLDNLVLIITFLLFGDTVYNISYSHSGYRDLDLVLCPSLKSDLALLIHHHSCRAHRWQ